MSDNDDGENNQRRQPPEVASTKEKKLFLTETSQLEKQQSARPKSSKINSAASNDLATADDANEEDDDEDPEEDQDEEEEEDDLDDEYDEYADEYPNPFYEFMMPRSDDKLASREKNVEEGVDERAQVEEEVRPISAIAPKIFQQDETQIEISSTPAFQCLEEVQFSFFCVCKIAFKLKFLKNCFRLQAFSQWQTDRNSSSSTQSEIY
jgi:hypothetical protein